MSVVMDISGADVDSPKAAETMLQNLATCYGEMTIAIEQFRDNQEADRLGPEIIEFLNTMHDQCVQVAGQLTAGAERAQKHHETISDTIAVDDDLAETQEGGYADTARL